MPKKWKEKVRNKENELQFAARLKTSSNVKLLNKSIWYNAVFPKFFSLKYLIFIKNLRN